MPKRDSQDLNVLIAALKGAACKTVGLPFRDESWIVACSVSGR